MEISKVISDYIENGCEFIGEVIIDAFNERLNEAGEYAFSEAIQIGVNNTLSALYDANVPDNEIIRVVCKYWGIEVKVATKMLVREKQQFVLRELREYLELQGYSEKEIDRIWDEKQVIRKIKLDKELWELKNKPKELFERIGL